MGVHAYIQWAHYVCASWGEVRARVHARGHTHTESERRTSVCAGGARLSLPHSYAATTAAAAAHATRRRSKRGEVVWEAAVLPSLSLSPVVVLFFITSASSGFSFVLLCFFSPSSFLEALDSCAFFGITSLPSFSASLFAVSLAAKVDCGPSVGFAGESPAGTPGGDPISAASTFEVSGVSDTTGFSASCDGCSCGVEVSIVSSESPV
ncbi:nucleolar RNA helicase II [Trypanosoma cruzi]|uniref:Nucleolar RNA helicase II n=1 Tax=Trypanosoma cruzi TaxID=5693 RepID=A0A7J6XHB7_TRYCR|nr:nucleolar RNA helicase II [Trypanosoma cruzi]